MADIIAVSTTPAAQVAKNATRTIPIVMIALGDPVGTGRDAAKPSSRGLLGVAASRRARHYVVLTAT